MSKDQAKMEKIIAKESESGMPFLIAIQYNTVTNSLSSYSEIEMASLPKLLEIPRRHLCVPIHVRH